MMLKAYSSSRFTFHDNIWPAFVKPNADGVQFDFKQASLLRGLSSIEHHNDEVGRFGNYIMQSVAPFA